MSGKIDLASAKTAIVDAGLEEKFLAVTGLKSLDELSPDNFREYYGKADSLTKQLKFPSAEPLAPPLGKKEDADAPPRPQIEEASDYLSSFKDLTIRFPPRPVHSTFTPSPHIMYVIVHIMNNLLVDHFYFLRAAPNYHPALLRIYFGVIFVIQTLRAQHAANILETSAQNEFLKRFLDAYPVDTLPIPAPLLHIFKSLCASKPEIPQLALVVPFLPGKLVPSGSSLLKDANNLFASTTAMYLPDICGILSMLDKQKVTSSFKKGFHPKISATGDTSFRGMTLDKDTTTWSSWSAWSLRAPGIEHPFESGKKLNESFFEDRIEDLSLPTVGGNDDVGTIDSWLRLHGSLSWFSEVRDLATTACKFFPGSGSLSDCPPLGLRTGQIVMQTIAPATVPTQPTSFTNDSKFNLDIKYRLLTTCRSISQMEVILAGASGINMRLYKTHPASNAGKSIIKGKFWDIRPIESGTSEEDRFFGLTDSIKRGIKERS
jgi:hypothetical protein